MSKSGQVAAFLAVALTVFMSLALAVFAFVAWVVGLIMTFQASVVLGIICLFLEVPFPLESIVYWITGYDIAQHLAKMLGLL